MSKPKTISWNTVTKLCRDIGDQVRFPTPKMDQPDKTYPDHVIGLSRGGLIPATIIANYLKVRTVISHGYHSYDDETQTRDYRNPHGVMYQDGIIDLRKGLTGPNVLIVDDLCDEGITLAGLVDRIKGKFHEGVINIRTATLCCKTRSCFRPDYIGQEVGDDWITFPWEALS